MIQSVALSFLRHILTAAGTLAVTKGYADADSMTQIVGAIVTFATLVWAAVEKKNREA